MTKVTSQMDCSKIKKTSRNPKVIAIAKMLQLLYN